MDPEKIKEAKEAGLSDRELARRLGVHQTTLSEKRRQMGIERLPGSGRRASGERHRGQVEELLIAGLSPNAVDVRLGLYRGATRYYLRSRGLTIRHEGAHAGVSSARAGEPTEPGSPASPTSRKEKDRE